MDSLIVCTNLQLLCTAVQYIALERTPCSGCNRHAFRGPDPRRAQATEKRDQARHSVRRYFISGHACTRQAPMNQLGELLIVARLQSADNGRSSFAAIRIGAMARSASSPVLLFARL